MTTRTVFLTLGATLLAGPAMSAHLDYYLADLTGLNGSGVTGKVFLTYNGPEDDSMRSLTVQVAASGFEPGAHAAHIHGFSGDERKASVAPTPDVFDPNVAGPGNDGDGFIELTEGAPFYGGILQTLTGLTADAAGNIFYEMVFDVIAGSELDDDLFSLDNREVVFHGMTTGFEPIDVIAGLGGDIDGNRPAALNFNTLLPIATAKFERATLADRPAPVPLPAAGWMLFAGLGGLGVMRRARRKG